ncbi:DUF4232 domain-containing protein [Micromonospora sp. NPDC003197]
MVANLGSGHLCRRRRMGIRAMARGRDESRLQPRGADHSSLSLPGSGVISMMSTRIAAVVAGVALVLVAGCTSAQPEPRDATSAGGAQAGVVSCAAAEMKMRQVPDSDARRHDSGAFEGVTLAVTNTGDRPCALSGYLDLAISDRSGKPVQLDGGPVRHYGRFAPDPGSRQLVINPGSAAYTELAFDDSGSARSGFQLTFKLPGGHGDLKPPIDVGTGMVPDFTITALTDRPLLLPTEPFNEEGYSQAKLD